MNPARIVHVAHSFLGQREIPPNAGFVDPDFERAMRSVGWWPGAAWCALFTELVWRNAYVEDGVHQVWERIEPWFSAAAVRTFNSFKARSPQPVTKEPAEGAIAVWRMYSSLQPLPTGHAGIVVEAAPTSFKSIEGNTNEAGGREGDCVAIKTRKLAFEPKRSGLVLLGFINPI